jgi:hypothetical protein
MQLPLLVDKLSSYLDAPGVTHENLLQVGNTCEFGIPDLVEGLWKRLKPDRFFGEQLQQRKYEKPVHQAMLGMVINRCLHPYSKRATEEWWSQAVYFPPADELELHHYDRGMDFLLDTQPELEMALYAHYRQLHDQSPEMVFSDTPVVTSKRTPTTMKRHCGTMGIVETIVPTVVRSWWAWRWIRRDYRWSVTSSLATGRT